MPEENLPELPEPHPSEPPTPAVQANGREHFGTVGAEQEIEPMPPSYTPAPSPASADPVHEDSPQRIPYWLQQAERFLRVIVRMYLGLLVTCAPWYPAAWDNNPLFSSSPWLTAVITHGAVRGLVSGLGILNLWIAVRDALRSSGKSDTR